MERLDERREDGIALRRPVKAGQIEVEAEEPPHLRGDRLADGGVAHAGDPHVEARAVHGPARVHLVGEKPPA